jgi:hypothetical protein
MQFGRQEPTFQRYFLPPSSGYKRKASGKKWYMILEKDKTTALKRTMATDKNGGTRFLQNNCMYLPNCTMSCPRKL